MEQIQIMTMVEKKISALFSSSPEDFGFKVFNLLSDDVITGGYVNEFFDILEINSTEMRFRFKGAIINDYCESGLDRYERRIEDNGGVDWNVRVMGRHDFIWNFKENQLRSVRNKSWGRKGIVHVGSYCCVGGYQSSFERIMKGRQEYTVGYFFNTVLQFLMHRNYDDIGTWGEVEGDRTRGYTGFSSYMSGDDSVEELQMKLDSGLPVVTWGGYDMDKLRSHIEYVSNR